MNTTELSLLAPDDAATSLPSRRAGAGALADQRWQYAWVNLSALLRELRVDGPAIEDATEGVPDSVEGLCDALRGRSFAGGLYRVHPRGDVARWTAGVAEAFPDFADRVTCFGYDWLGGQFAIDRARSDASGQPLILLFEPGTGKALDLPVNLAKFHEHELIEHADSALAEQFYREWRTQSGDEFPLSLGECVGYRVPLFLGGKDDVENLERADLEVYWTLSGQMLKQIR